jgi:hypothetical protein
MPPGADLAPTCVERDAFSQPPGNDWAPLVRAGRIEILNGARGSMAEIPFDALKLARLSGGSVGSRQGILGSCG